jgi:hypothetical protein
MTAVLAMLFLAIFGSLAVGFYATVNTSTQIAGNDQRTTGARMAAESGMQFVRHHLANLDIPAGTSQAELFDEVFVRLAERLDGTTNMHDMVVAKSSDGSKILVPGSESGYIRINPQGMEFRAEIAHYGDNGLRVKVTGRANGGITSSSGGARAVQLDYDVAENAATIFNYGVASKSPVLLNSNARITGAGNANLGSLLSTSDRQPTVQLDGNAQISGDVSFSSPDANLVMSSNSTIAGYDRNDPELSQHVHHDVEEPEFPVIDTDAFKPFVGASAGYGGMTITPPNSAGETKFDSGTVRNVLIKSSPHPDRWVVFDSNMKVDGIVYIETPNKVKFNSNVDIRGAIVVQNDPTHDHTRNRLEFHSNVKIQPIETLKGVNATYFPNDLTSLTGSTILAPKFKVVLNSNFGTTGGSIVADEIHFDSNAVGTVRGSVLNLADTFVEMDSNARITIEAMGTNNYPTGVHFGSHYEPLPGTYREVLP